MATDEELLLEQVTAAWRPKAADGSVRGHPAFYDLDGPGRRRAYEAALVQRRVEASLDSEGLSTTARAVLAVIWGRKP